MVLMCNTIMYINWVLFIYQILMSVLTLMEAVSTIAPTLMEVIIAHVLMDTHLN